MDKSKYISLVSQLRQHVVARASSIIKDEDCIEDIAQEVLLKMWENADNLDDDVDRVFAYASTTAKNIALNKIRSKRRHPILRLLRWSSDDEEENENPINRIGTNITPLHHLEEKEANEAFLKALNKLPYNWQRILIMRQTEGCSFEEIARVLGTTESSVRGILSKARKRIIEQIKQS